MYLVSPVVLFTAGDFFVVAILKYILSDFTVKNKHSKDFTI